MRNWFLGQVGGLVASAAAVLAVASPARADWHIETVDSAAYWNIWPSLVIDVDGNPHVAYVKTGTGDLQYAKRVGGIWQIETVPIPYPGAANPSLALDSQARAHLAHFVDSPGLGGSLYHTYWTGTQWVSSNRIEEGGNLHPSLALTAADEPRIAFLNHGDNGDRLRYAVPSGSSWSIQNVYGSGYGCCGFTPTLALDSGDNPRIGWGYAGYFIYAWADGATWPNEALGGGENVDQYSAGLALDTADQPHAVFVKQLANGCWLTYATRVGGVWSLETVTSPAARSRVALDAYDRPHIAYAGSSWENPGPLKYAHRTTSSWCIQTVDDAHVGCVSIAVDPDGNPHIAYYDHTNVALKYAWWDPAVYTGDLDCSGCVDFGDINPFVLALTNPAGYQQAFPNCNVMNADINADGRVDFGDINPFVRLLTQP